MVNTDRQKELVDNNKFEGANVLVIGCGAIGSQFAPMAQRLGCKKFTLVDGDDVEDHNLNRQFFTLKHVGKNKALAVEAQLRAVDPDVDIEVIATYIDDDEPLKDLGDIGRFTHIMYAADTLYLGGNLYKAVYGAAKAVEKPPVLIVGRMDGFNYELFVRDDAQGIVPKTLYWSDKRDKNYGDGATCTGAKIEERKIPSIATTTTFLASLAAEAFLHTTQGIPVTPHIRANLRAQLGGDRPVRPVEPVQPTAPTTPLTH